jgi:hypothetical protein
MFDALSVVMTHESFIGESLSFVERRFHSLLLHFGKSLAL